ncbi:MAG: ABC transporter permease [Oscillospiraceae bacterium]
MSKKDRYNTTTPAPQAAVYTPAEGDFEWVGSDADQMEAIARPSISFWKDAMTRLFKSVPAVICMIVLVAIIAMVVFVPMVSPYSVSEQHVEHGNAGFMYQDPVDGHVHILDTDYLGRDLFVRLWSGGRVSLFIAVAVVAINCCIGMAYGGISGFFGGALDNFMMRVVEIVNGIPYLIIVILMLTVMEPGVSTIIIAYAMVGWTGMARLVRGQIFSLKEQEFVVAAQAMGASPMRVIARHLLPNTLSVIIVNITLAIPSAIFTEAFLSYIGLGIPIPLSSWGTMANEGAVAFQMYPGQLFYPALLISLTMLSFNILGDALRDAFDPKLRR